MAFSDSLVERSAQDRRSGTDRRLEQAILDRLDRFGISITTLSGGSPRNEERRKAERRKGERRKSERRVLM